MGRPRKQNPELDKAVEAIADRTPKSQPRHFFTEAYRRRCRSEYNHRRTKITLGGRRFQMRPHSTNRAYFIVTPERGSVPMACLSRTG